MPNEVTQLVVQTEPLSDHFHGKGIWAQLNHDVSAIYPLVYFRQPKYMSDEDFNDFINLLEVSLPEAFDVHSDLKTIKWVNEDIVNPDQLDIFSPDVVTTLSMISELDEAHALQLISSDKRDRERQKLGVSLYKQIRELATEQKDTIFISDIIENAERKLEESNPHPEG
jgi:hypothetical protein